MPMPDSTPNYMPNSCCISSIKVIKWVTLHTDGTGRLQTAIINFIMTITQANDPIFLPVLFSASILPEDETAVVQHDVIVSFIEEKNSGYINLKT